MRPEAPPSGQRVLLERITPIWKRLSFTRKSTIRNLVRYKKRLIMTVIGVGGCMGLLLVGFGIHDSINEIAKQQYINIFKQDAVITYESSADRQERGALQELAESCPGIRGSEQVSMVSVDLTYGSNIRNAYLYIPQDTAQIGEYLSLRSRTSGESYSYPEEGAVICEKTAKMLFKALDDIGFVENKRVSFPVYQKGPLGKIFFDIDRINKMMENVPLPSPEEYRNGTLKNLRVKYHIGETKIKSRS
jgi:putative ABC transport system permease protein